MRLLWLSNETADVAGQGGQRRQFFQIRTLAEQGHDVDVVTLAGPQDDSSVRPYANVRRLRTHVAPRLPDPRLRRGLRRLVRSDRWDRIVVAHTESWGLVRAALEAPTAPLLLDMHNVLSDWHRRLGEPEASRRWRQVEAEAGGRADVVTVCSHRERSALGSMERARVDVLPHGVDPGEWARQPTAAEHPVVKLFGGWDWHPNAAGLEWFLREVWPVVHDRTGAGCEVAGSGANAVAGPSGDAGFAVRGRVPSVPGFLADSWVVAVPVREGVGAPVKYAEALASGVPVVATSDAADVGTAGAADAALVSDDPLAWQEGMVAMLTDPDPWRRQAAATRERTLESRSWARCCDPLLDWCAVPR